MAYFKALGHLVCDSGGPEILVQSNVLGKGSLNGFVGGKHFNTCKRLHPLLANALSHLHLKQFIDDLHAPPEEDLEILMNVNKDQPEQDAINKVFYCKFIQDYMDYKEKNKSRVSWSKCKILTAVR